MSNISEEGDPQHSSSYSGAQKNEVDTEHRSRSFEQARTEPATSHAAGNTGVMLGKRLCFPFSFLVFIFISRTQGM